MKKLFLIGLYSISLSVAIIAVGYNFVNPDLKEFLFHNELSFETKMKVAAEIRKVAELTTAEQTITVLIPVKYPTKLVGVEVGNTQYTYKAVGTISAGIDLAKFKPEDIRIRGNDIQVTIPSSTILRKYLNVKESEAIGYNKTFIASDVPPLRQKEIEVEALKQIQDQALEQKLLVQADQNASQLVQSLLKKILRENGKLVSVSTRSQS